MPGLRQILKNVRLVAKGQIDDCIVSGISCDSRSVRRGSVFIAVRGSDYDGSEFIPEAVARGAVIVVSEKDFAAPKGVRKIVVDDSRRALAVMADNFYGHPSDKIKITGVTGTNGKTTITYLIEGIIRSCGGKPGVIGTINNRFGGKVMQSKNTTPGPIELQSILYDMLEDGISHVAMEVSSHSLDQGRVDGVSFDAAIFTNITSDHLDYHKTPSRYFDAKKKIFDHMKSGGTAIVNNDDKNISLFARSLRCNLMTYGIKADADVKAAGIKLSENGSSFDLITPKGDVAIESSLIGFYNVSNMLAAAASSIALDIGIDTIKDAFSLINVVPGRLETVKNNAGFKVFVDYAHTEDALRNVLGLMRDLTRKRLITVFGCGGDRDSTKRPLMGRAACKFSDYAVITSDNPRFEKPESIIADIEAGVRDDFSNYCKITDRREAIEKALLFASEGDIVIIAGKGHEDYQVIGDKKMHFDDREVVRDVLRSRGMA